MLSYRHAFHAGNFADVLKHSVLTLILDYMTQKEKGISYIDSHSGAGMYQLKAEYAQKTGEYKDGIEKILACQDLPAPFLLYVDLIKEINADASDLSLYPGSPGIAKAILRRQDSAHLYDLHPTDFSLLTEFCERWRKSNVNQSDGYKGVLSQLPPATRRGVVLIDPPFELKEDYIKAVDTIIKGYKKFANGTYILWYPVVTRHRVENMENRFKMSDVKNVLQVEYCQKADSDEYGMTGTGLFIVNPPWTLNNHLQEILPCMKSIIGEAETSYHITQLIAE